MDARGNPLHLEAARQMRYVANRAEQEMDKNRAASAGASRALQYQTGMAVPSLYSQATVANIRQSRLNSGTYVKPSQPITTLPANQMTAKVGSARL